MSKKYESLAKEIVTAIGGKENVANAFHCQTRLRFTLKDEKSIDDKKVESIDGVQKVIRNAGVYQVVIGTHVADVFEEVEKLVDIKSGVETEATKVKKNIAETVIDFVAAVFQPVIPALSGAGMVKALLALLVVCKVIDNTSQTYQLLNLFADGVFYFLPMILAYTTAQKMKCNPILAVGVAAMMMHPNWTAMVSAGDPVQFFSVIPFRLTSYSNSVIPIILIIFVQSYVEKALKKIIPKAVELVFVPMFTFLIMGTLAFSALGPLGSIVGGWMATFFTFLSVNASWAPAVLIGGLLPVMVMFGIHNGVAPLGVMQMANLGYDSIFGPGCVCSNMAQATAGAVVAFRTRNKKTKQVATSGSITAYMGITEPILYGVNLPKKYPLVAAMIGGGFGGLYAGLTHTHRFATGSSGLPAVLLYIGDDTMTYFVNIIIAIVISIVVSGVVTFILSLKYEKDENIESEKDEKKEIAASTLAEGNSTTIYVPVIGEVHPLSDAADEAFASEALGKGAMIIPTDETVVSPVDGTIEMLFDTGHAVGITSDDGVELLVHIGIDTVNMQGKGFQPLVKQGDHVKKGDKLIQFSIDEIKNAGYSEQTMVIVTNTPDYAEVTATTGKSMNAGDAMINVSK
ncbi:beta-glucoside-specific PTS transporter subunit IIABC [Lachnospira pectinoschiza]|uniref:PTS system, beta-glucosides-specific IIC component n=1 Tax=Lachnospira pectinoschiza TaxID=28052 RepID=A0A1H0A2S4_9FIRM|nr:beta-glucoside-specific PTS transporter subunit IIABC [Lachnospira pectinoschiza]SDN27511.1 PTS system, beta-glucosides-specific IIC component [Lachnospira pectinoschiza]